MRMVKADVHDDAALGRIDHVRGVEAAAEAGLQHDDLTALPLEPEHGGGRDQFKFRRNPAARSTEASIAAQLPLPLVPAI